MNTDIVHFDPDADLSSRKFAPGALKLFILLSIPLMLVTCIVWRYLNRRASSKVEERLQSRRTNTTATDAV